MDCLLSCIKKITSQYIHKKERVEEKKNLLEKEEFEEMDETEIEKINKEYLEALIKYENNKKKLSSANNLILKAILRQINEGDVPLSQEKIEKIKNEKELYLLWFKYRGWSTNKAKLEFISEFNEIFDS